MPIKYFPAPDIEEKSKEIVLMLDWKHIDIENVGFLRSTGSKSRGTIARCHALGKAMQKAMKRKRSFYLVEVISERFDKLPDEEQVEVIIHELMHIPKTFGGGFVHHDRVSDKAVKEVYEHYCNLKEGELDKIKKSFGDKVVEDAQSIIDDAQDFCVKRRWF
jgi:predicted metallopeptidase